MELIIQKYNFSFEVELVGFPFTSIHDYTEANEKEELRIFRTRRKQLHKVHIMINLITGIRHTPSRWLKQWWTAGTCRMHTKISPSYTIKVGWLQAMGPLVGPIDKGVIWVTTAAFNLQGVLYGHQRHTLTTAHCALKPTAIARAQTHTIMPLAQQTSRADHTIRGHSYWPENSACVSRHLDFWHLPPLTLMPPQASLKRTSVDVIHFVPSLPPNPSHSTAPYLLLHMHVVIPTKIKLPLV